MYVCTELININYYPTLPADRPLLGLITPVFAVESTAPEPSAVETNRVRRIFFEELVASGFPSTFRLLALFSAAFDTDGGPNGESSSSCPKSIPTSV
jgi:hypothetical protein